MTASPKPVGYLPDPPPPRRAGSGRSRRITHYRRAPTFTSPESLSDVTGATSQASPIYASFGKGQPLCMDNDFMITRNENKALQLEIPLRWAEFLRQKEFFSKSVPSAIDCQIKDPFRGKWFPQNRFR